MKSMTFASRRQMMKAGAQAAVGFAVSRMAGAGVAGAQAAMPAKGGSRKDGKLAAGAYRMLPLGEVRASGWLGRQLRVQADGMGGHLDEFWPDVGPNSGWLGGTGESWERGPYFLDGLVPLAYLLQDDVLKAKAQKFIDWVLTTQRADGMFGPASNDDWWPRMVMVKVLAQYHEATADPRVLPALTRYFHYQLAAMPGRPLKEWGRFRWQDEVYVIEWLYERTADEELLKLAALLKEQGYDWTGSFTDFQHKAVTTRAYLKSLPKERRLESHGVNNAQGLKAAAVQYRLSGAAADRAAFAHQMRTLDEFHGQPNGMFSCDEHLAGLAPEHGAELCSVVETMFSLEVALATFGEAWIGDRVEKLAFNALPGTFTDDMWTHQYDQQANQVQVGLLSTIWTSDGPESNLFGLEPHFGCCTANFHQGWPKFVTSLWMGTADGGIAATLYGPSEVRTKLGGVPVSIHEETEYPFAGTIRMTVSPEKAVSFPLSARIPGWAEGSVVRVNGAVAGGVKAGTFWRMERVWKAGDVVEISLPMKPRVSRWFQRSIAVERGPLVFSHSPGETWVKLRDRGMTADWQVYPTGAWNYGLAVDEASVGMIEVSERAVSGRPFAAEGTAVVLQVPARKLDKWRSADGVAQSPPLSPVQSEAADELIALIPYAAAKLRVTAFPSLVS